MSCTYNTTIFFSQLHSHCLTTVPNGWFITLPLFFYLFVNFIWCQGQRHTFPTPPPNPNDNSISCHCRLTWFRPLRQKSKNKKTLVGCLPSTTRWYLSPFFVGYLPYLENASDFLSCGLFLIHSHSFFLCSHHHPTNTEQSSYLPV